MNTKAKAAIVILVLLVGAGILLVVTKQGAKQAAAPTTPEEQQSAEEAGLVSSTEIALLDYSASMPGLDRGCDRVILIDWAIPPTNDPLTSAMETLFATEETQIRLNSFIPKTASTLSFERARLEDGVAKIYLRGSLSGLAGVCDNPRAKIQIEETALRVRGVESVELYLNGERTELQPNEQGE